MNKIMRLVVGALSFWACGAFSADATINVGIVPSFAVTQQTLLPTDKPISSLTISVPAGITTGRAILKTQTASFSVAAGAQTGIFFGGVLVQPGQSVQSSVTFNDNWQLTIPLRPAVAGVAGKSSFSVSLPDIIQVVYTNSFEVMPVVQTPVYSYQPAIETVVASDQAVYDYQPATETIPATTVNSYTCSAGYTKSGSGASTTCSQTTTQSVSATSYNSYPRDVYFHSACSVFPTSIGATGSSSSFSYPSAGCNNSYMSYSGAYSTSTGSYTQRKSYWVFSCPAGSDQPFVGVIDSSVGSYSDLSNRCSKGVTTTIAPTVTTTKTCLAGWALSGSSCSRTLTDTSTRVAGSTLTCASGSLDGLQCRTQTGSTPTCTVSGFTVADGRCQRELLNVANKTPDSTLWCPTGTLENSRCRNEVSVN